MAKSHIMTEKLITEFTENYMEKLFYFCLKKTGSIVEAEDLTQDIALNILTALSKGTIPSRFSAWVWQIARNRYSVWADNKHRKAESVAGVDISDYEIEDDSESTLDKMIRSEQLARLRQELAFIGSEYRNIVVAYYIDNRSVRNIAKELSLSEAAVKQRLYRARNILKEGMNMAREFGVRSYRPEEVSYSMTHKCLGSKKQLQSIMEHMLYKNIFLEAYGNPSSASELSLELGVALPYMENELEYLTRETFLMKKDNKYQTAFPIISRPAQEQVHVECLTAAPKITKALMNLVNRVNDVFKARGYDYFGTYQDYESAKWTFLMLAYQYCENKASRIFDFTKRPDGGMWDIVGFQRCEIKKPLFVGNYVRREREYFLQQFKFEPDKESSLASVSEYITDEETKVIYDAVTGNVMEADYEIAAKLAECGYLRRKGDNYEPAIPVMKINEIKDIIKMLDAGTVSELNALVNIAKKQLEDLYYNVAEIIRSDLPEVFRGDAHQCSLAIRECYFARGYVMEEALRQGYLLPAGEVSKAIGACIDLV